MQFNRIRALFTIVLLAVSALTQTPDDANAEKMKRQAKLLETIVADAKTLKLPENRAFVLAHAANAYWTTDEKLARRLFDEAAAELITAQTEAAAEKNGMQYFQALIYGQSPRHEILEAAGARDAGMALEMMLRTRPEKLARAVAEYGGSTASMGGQYAFAEITVEQKLLAEAALQDPQTAVKRIRESLKRGITYETVNLLERIYSKDPETAEKLAPDVAARLLEIDFAKDQQGAETAGLFIGRFGRETAPTDKVLRVPEKTIRDLAGKLFDFWLDPKTAQLNGYWNAQAVLEKRLPERFAAAKQKQDKLQNQYQTPEGLEYSKLTTAEASPDEMVARAPEFSPGYRNELYRLAADKYAQNGNFELAEKLLRTNITEEESDRYLSQYYSNFAIRAAGEDRFEAAQGFASQITDDNQKLTALIYLAQRLYQKDREKNLSAALGILRAARETIDSTPESQEDLNRTATLASAFAELDPGESFRLLEPLAGPLNELAQATFVMAKFRSYGGYRQGELQMAGAYYPGISYLDSLLQTLRDKDFERTLRFTNGFERPEVRLKLQLRLLDESLTAGGTTISLPISGRFSKIDFR
ncbi:MAG: hypothetical protein JSS81_20395 [Acidobacteria bacterium]|nr:hypothetical protein [Acidobacteriota bacterium]